MLRFLRKYSSSSGIKILYSVLVLLFVVWGVGAVRGERVDVVARVRGETISRRDLDRATTEMKRREENLRHRFPGMPPSPDVRGLALDRLIEQALVRHEAARLGIMVTDAEVVETITRSGFTRARLEAFLNERRDRGEFENDLRRDLLQERVHALVTDGVDVSDAEVEERYRLDHDQVRLAFVRIAAAPLAQGIDASDDELEQYLTAHADQYRVPTRVRARYVAYRPADFLAEERPTDGEVAEYYELHKEERFTDPEEVRARHILVTPKGADEEAKTAARKKAQDLLAQVKAGEDFAALATKSSDDPVSAANGGDLGLFSRGRLAPAFEEAAFGLEPGAVSDVVETPFGFHIIKVEQHQPAGIRPLEAVRDEILETLRKERSVELARKQAEADRRKIARGTPFAEALADRKIEETPPFGADDDVPGIGPVKDFTETALSLGEREVSDLIDVDDAIYLLAPFERVEAHTPQLAEVRDRVLADLRRERGEAAAKERGEKLFARARETDLDAAAAEAGLTVEETGPFDRNATSIPKIGAAADLRVDAFGLSPGVPLAPKVYAASGDAIVATFRGRNPADLSGLASAKDGLRQTILAQKRQAALTAYMDYLKDRAHREGAFEVFADKLGRG